MWMTIFGILLGLGKCVAGPVFADEAHQGPRPKPAYNVECTLCEASEEGKVAGEPRHIRLKVEEGRSAQVVLGPVRQIPGESGTGHETVMVPMGLCINVRLTRDVAGTMRLVASLEQVKSLDMVGERGFRLQKRSAEINQVTSIGSTATLVLAGDSNHPGNTRLDVKILKDH
jgi:hypothetical protein